MRVGPVGWEMVIRDSPKAIKFPATTNIMKASLSCWLSTTAFPSQYRAGENPAAAPIHARYSSHPPPEGDSSG